MGSKTTTTNTIPGAGAQENTIRGLLQNLASSQAGQLGDLSQLAQGQLQGPTADDLALITNTLDRTRDITSRNLNVMSQEGQARLSEQLASRGISGASIESVDRAILERDLTRQGANLMDQSRIEANQALMQLPFQRAQVQLGANQTLLQGLLGASNPLLQSLQQDRLAQSTQVTETGADPAKMIQAGIALAAAIPTGGLSLAAMPTSFSSAPGMVPGTNTPTSLQGGFSSALRMGNK